MKIDRDIAVKMRAEGATFREIGERFGASQQAVRQLLGYENRQKLMHMVEVLEKRVDELRPRYESQRRGCLKGAAASAAKRSKVELAR